mmetsp:Transcript_4397/g.11951  ORF Transcript_4397/g.11951 Transcript_4397/m.11951 type:complete len:222 (+) Transcript_4397:751-1416(+)
MHGLHWPILCARFMTSWGTLRVMPIASSCRSSRPSSSSSSSSPSSTTCAASSRGDGWEPVRVELFLENTRLESGGEDDRGSKIVSSRGVGMSAPSEALRRKGGSESSSSGASSFRCRKVFFTVRPALPRALEIDRAGETLADARSLPSGFGPERPALDARLLGELTLSSSLVEELLRRSASTVTSMVLMSRLVACSFCSSVVRPRVEDAIGFDPTVKVAFS